MGYSDLNGEGGEKMFSRTSRQRFAQGFGIEEGLQHPITMNKKLATLAIVSLLTSLSVKAQFTAGNLLVYRVGNGSTTLANTGNAVFIDEWTTTGTYVQTVSPGVFASGTATSEGLLSRSPNGQYVTFTGYVSASASGNINSTAANVSRTVSVLSSNKTLTTTSFAQSDVSPNNNVRSAATTNGTDLWISGGAGGIRYGTTAGGTTTLVSSGTLANYRSVFVSGSQLYATTNSTAGSNTIPLGAVGSGLPTSTTSAALTALSGIPALTGTSYYEAAFVTLGGNNLLYIADDAGTIRKFSDVSGTWTANGSVSAAGVRGLAVSVSGSTVSIFGSTGSSSATGSGTVYSFSDTTGFNASVSGTATSLFTNSTLKASIGGTATNYAFRGLEFAPVAAIPEPSTYAAILGGVALLGVAARRRRSV